MHSPGTGSSGTLSILKYHGRPRLAVAELKPDGQELQTIVETIARVGFGGDKAQRDCIVHEFCRAGQALGEEGEHLLLKEVNAGLMARCSVYRLRFGDLRAPSFAARALEIVDIKINQVIDRMLFGVVSVHNVVPISGR